MTRRRTVAGATSATGSSTRCSIVVCGWRRWPRPTAWNWRPAETPQARDPRDSDWMYDAVLTQLRDVIVPRTTDPLAQARGKGVARIIKYLARVDTYGPYYEECELQDLEKLLGRRPDSVVARPGGRRGGGRSGRRVRGGLHPHAVAPDRPRDRAGPSLHGRARRPALASTPMTRGPMSTAFGVDLDQRRAERTIASSYRRTTTSTTRSSPTAGGRPRRAGSPGTCPSGISVAGRTARPDRTPTSATAGPGCGTTGPPTRGSWPIGPSTRAAAATPGRTRHAGLRVAQRRPCPGRRTADHLCDPLQRPRRARG